MTKAVLMAALALVALAGCNGKKSAEAPPPAQELTSAAIGHYCGMNVLEHAGPKGQIILSSRKEPVWFSSARDAISFTMLPEEPKDIRAIYVSDMARAADWDKPGETNWIDAKQAHFVIDSRKKGGMGADEAVPFSSRESAQRFSAENGGRVVDFAEIPKDYILGGEKAEAAEPPHNGGGRHDAHAAPTATTNRHAH